LPEHVREKLEEAERALKAGDPEKAIHVARSIYREPHAGAACSLLVRAYCHQRDLSNVRAHWSHVPKSDRTRVRQYCLQYEMEL
jgi:serine/threonine-protein kinase